MMDDNIDVDDLFGDPGSLELGLHTSSLAKGLAQRLDELHFLGCCRYEKTFTLYHSAFNKRMYAL
jgi:mediator of RNA polymerase II transcription subunit 16